MKRFPFTPLLLLPLLGVASPASGQGDEIGPDPEQAVEDARRQVDLAEPPEIFEPDDLDQIKQLLEERIEQRERNGGRDAIEEQLQRLLIERKLDLQAQLDDEERIELPDGVILRIEDGAVIRRPRAQVVGGPGVEEAQPYTDPLAERPRGEVVALLNDDDYAVREQAEANLLMDDTLDRAALRGLIASAESAEQRYRLLRVAEHHVMRAVRERLFGERDDAAVDGFRRRQNASVGFSYSSFLGDENPVTQTPGVMVTATMPGFPGHAYLRTGDRIIAINGQTARGIRHRELIEDWVRNRIGFHQPGDTITLTVIRENKTLDVSMPCAQGQALMVMYVSNGLAPATRQGEYTQMWLDARAELVRGVAPPKALVPKTQ
jgi:hypothetical protein